MHIDVACTEMHALNTRCSTIAERPRCRVR